MRLNMTLIAKLSYREVKISMIDTLKVLMEKVDNTHKKNQ